MSDPRRSKVVIRERKLAPKVIHHPLDHYFEIFFRAKKAEGLRERTLKDHQQHYGMFKNWLLFNHPSLTLESMTSDHIRQYIQYMLYERQQYTGHPILEKKKNQPIGLSPSTINIRTRTLRCFLRFLHQEDYLKKDICKSIKLQKVEQDTIEGFSKEEMLSLLSVVNQREYVGFRDYVLMVLLFDTGMRINEALSIRVENVDLTDRTIIIPASVAKNRKSRTVPITMKTSDLLHDLYTENELAFGKDVEFFFYANYGNPLTYQQAYTRIRHYGRLAKINYARVSPHTFRHTFAKFYVLNGGDPFTLQKILGHSTMEMVRKYIQLNLKDLKDKHELNSPMAKL
jgi:integrase/recombinase XerD